MRSRAAPCNVSIRRTVTKCTNHRSTFRSSHLRALCATPAWSKPFAFVPEWRYRLLGAMWLRGGLVGPSASAQCPLAVETGRLRDSASPRRSRLNGGVLHSGLRRVPHRGAATGLCGLNSGILSGRQVPSRRSRGLGHAHAYQPSQPAQSSASIILASSNPDSACEALRGFTGRGRGPISHGGVTCRCNSSDTQHSQLISVGTAMGHPSNVEPVLPIPVSALLLCDIPAAPQ